MNGRTRWQAIVWDRKERRLKHCLNIRKTTAEQGCPHYRFASRPVKRGEEGQPLDVIPVVVGEHDWGLSDIGTYRFPEADDARTGIEDQEALGGLVEQLDTRRITP
jgi:hypothetical protein